MIRIDKYTNIDRGADPTKEYYINQNGTYLSLTKTELEKVSSDLKLLGIGAVSGRSELLATHECKFYVNAEWTKLKCECGKEQLPSG